MLLHHFSRGLSLWKLDVSRDIPKYILPVGVIDSEDILLGIAFGHVHLAPDHHVDFMPIAVCGCISKSENNTMFQRFRAIALTSSLTSDFKL